MDQILTGHDHSHIGAEDRTAHIHVDHEDMLVQLVGVIADERMAALQADLLAAVPAELNGTLRRVCHEVTRHLHIDDGACAVIEYALGELDGIVVCAEGNDLLRILCAFDLRHDVVGMMFSFLTTTFAFAAPFATISIASQTRSWTAGTLPKARRESRSLR